MNTEEKNKGPQAALNDTRFNIPFCTSDNFSEVDIVDGVFDLFALKKEAEESALKRVKQINEKHPNFSIEEKVLFFLSFGHYRRGPLHYAESAYDICKKQIKWCQENEEPITLTLSFFPFKVLNSLKTFAKNSFSVDLGEVGSVLRFYEIAFGISCLYEHGARTIITADGVKYYDVFGYKKEDAILYSANLQKIIDYLGVGKYVEILEESNLYPKDFDDIKSECLKEVKNEFISGVSDTLELFRKLRCNIALCLNCAETGASTETLSKVFNSKLKYDDLIFSDPSAALLKSELEHRANEATFLYMATHKAGYKCDIYNKHLPHTIKATIHPKDGQIGLYAVNLSTDNFFPHHGQGYMSFNKKGDKLSNIRIAFAADIKRINVDGRIKGVVLDPEKYSFSDGKHPFTLIQEER